MSDFTLTNFGESRELGQVRHNLTADGNGETTVGIKAKMESLSLQKRKYQHHSLIIHQFTRLKTSATI